MKIPVNAKTDTTTYKLEHMTFAYKHLDRQITLVRHMHGKFAGKYEVVAVNTAEGMLMNHSGFADSCGCRDFFDDFIPALKFAEKILGEAILQHECNGVKH